MPAFFNLFADDGFDVVDADWDNLILLDACRYDIFEDINRIFGQLTKKRSWNSATAQWLRQNFSEGEYFDTVYVTANPKVSMALNIESKFHDVVQVWRDGWDDTLKTVTPEVMASRTLKVAESYPNKRIISHFVQPHFPFIGPKAQEWFDSQSGFEYSRKQLIDEKGTRTGNNIWQLARKGEVDRKHVLEAYKENLEITIPHVESLLHDLRGKSVVTSDHGNMVGEYAWPFPIRLYGHPPHIFTDELINVPWLEIKSGERKKINSEDPVSKDDTDHSLASDRLKQLGYLE